jgi:hypothetical protein
MKMNLKDYLVLSRPLGNFAEGFDLLRVPKSKEHRIATPAQKTTETP